jgi:hypothetical protein
MAEKKLSGVYVSWPRPDFTHAVKTNKQFKRNFYGAMQYAHYELSAIELKREVIKFLKHKDARHPMLDRIKDMNENRFITVGKYMYLLNHGCDIPDEYFSGLMPALEKVVYEEEIKQAATKKENTKTEESNLSTNLPVKNVISIQDRLKEKAREVAGEVEGWIDEFMCNKKQPAKTVEEFVNLFKSQELKSPHMRYMQTIFERRAEEISIAAAGTDKLLAEGYGNFTKQELKKFDLFHKNLLKACGMMQEVAKAERAPRKKKPVSTEKVVSKLKYKKDDKALGIVSVNPSQIIGSKEVWCFDVKTRKLTKYVADDIAGTLSVKGASIIGYNESKSISKTLRKPVDQLAAFKKCGKVQLRTFIDDIGTVGITPNGRVNENQVILRVA